MADVSVLDVVLHGRTIGTLTRLPGDRTLFAFGADYLADPDRPTLSLSFKDSLGGTLRDFRPTQTRILPFFANLLPEGPMRAYLAARAGVKPSREFFLLWALGQDLPGALSVRPADDNAWPATDEEGSAAEPSAAPALRFSLAGVQLKFSAIREAAGGLTIPAAGVGGSWIVKLPSASFEAVPENEFSRMTLARKVGVDVPEIQLVDLAEIGRLPEEVGSIGGKALAVRRFDRTADGPVHMEDFAQVFGVYPEEKYERASYRNIAEVIAAEAGQEDVAEFVRRLVFSTLIGNADMHLKNWSLLYPDRRHARLSPAYDLVSTIAYLPDEKAALTYARTKRMDGLTFDELDYLAAKARLPRKLVLDTAVDTVERFHEAWTSERANLPLANRVEAAIAAHVERLPLARGR